MRLVVLFLFRFFFAPLCLFPHEQMAKQFPQALFYPFKVNRAAMAHVDEHVVAPLARTLANPLLETFAVALNLCVPHPSRQVLWARPCCGVGYVCALAHCHHVSVTMMCCLVVCVVLCALRSLVCCVGVLRLTHPELRLKEGIRSTMQLLRLGKPDLARAKFKDTWEQCFEMQHQYVDGQVRRTPTPAHPLSDRPCHVHAVVCPPTLVLMCCGRSCAFVLLPAHARNATKLRCRSLVFLLPSTRCGVCVCVCVCAVGAQIGSRNKAFARKGVRVAMKAFGSSTPRTLSTKSLKAFRDKNIDLVTPPRTENMRPQLQQYSPWLASFVGSGAAARRVLEIPGQYDDIGPLRTLCVCMQCVCDPFVCVCAHACVCVCVRAKVS